MSERRTFTARVAGVEYQIPTTMTVLRGAEKASGASLIEAVAENKLGDVLQGVIFAELEAIGVKEIDGEPLTYEAVGDACDFAETTDNYIAFASAMSPETARQPAKNARAEGSKKASRGGKSSATATDSSS